MPTDDAPITRADLTAVLDRFAQAIIGNISDLRQEMNTRFQEVDRKFAAIDRRMERMAETMVSIDLRMGALSKWADTYDRDNGAILSNQAAQQRAIDQLA